MGNICCGGAEEKKANAFVEAKNSDVTDRPSSAAVRPLDQQSLLSSQHGGAPASLSPAPPGSTHPNDPSNTLSMSLNNNNNISSTTTVITPAEQKAADERFKAVQEEQRLELIVQATGRGMVPVRSPRGSTGYYDQGFAAALAQHLEQTTVFPERLAVPLPPPCRSNVYACLAQPEWVALGTKDGENPVAYMDHMAEQFLDATIPKKERLFANVAPIMENLL